MIELSKVQKPAWLTANGKAKTSEYKLAPKGKKPSPWRADEVVAALKEECSKKCMYCECTIDDAAYSAVEHIKPKEHFEDLVLEWDNLGLACTRCNTNKGSFWTEQADLQLLNPYQDRLSEHIEFRGPLTVALLTSSRAENTLRKLKFNLREDLLMSRMRRIEDLEVRLRIWHKESDVELKELFAEDVTASISRNCEFTGLLRAYAMESGFPVD